MWFVIALWLLYLFVEEFAPLPDKASFALLGTIAWTGLIFSGVAAQIYRYIKISSPTERAQTKWVVFGFLFIVAGVICLGFVLGTDARYSQGASPQRLLFQVSGQLVLLIGIAIPIGIATLRHRLYDIDVIIRRTLVYGALTGLLALLFLGGITVLQAVLGPAMGSSQLVTVVTTLGIAALALPLRNRIQAVIDRRFYRKKYDAQKVLDAFASRLQTETDVDGLAADVTSVIQAKLRPSHVRVWLVKNSPGPEGHQRSPLS